MALRNRGFDIVRITDRLAATATDREIVHLAHHEKATIITQDLDFSAIIAQNGLDGPSVITLRVADAKPDTVTRILLTMLPLVHSDLIEGAIVSADEKEYRIKKPPVFGAENRQWSRIGGRQSQRIVPVHGQNDLRIIILMPEKMNAIRFFRVQPIFIARRDISAHIVYQVSKELGEED